LWRGRPWPTHFHFGGKNNKSSIEIGGPVVNSYHDWDMIAAKLTEVMRLYCRVSQVAIQEGLEKWKNGTWNALYGFCTVRVGMT